ncbi:MAG: isoleucine--tRNA ligase [Armatimonadetes bacterium]|nr:isoleucine--tRNA ligase [Armatimonadota bacterium]
MFKPFEGQVDYPKLELEILGFWEENRIFDKFADKNRGKPLWSFIDGPITANNAMGVHHAWGRTYKDVFQRFKAMQGYDLRLQNGFDCQGLWVEVEVEKDLGLDSKRDIIEYGLERFSRECRARVERFADRIVQQSIRLGQWMRWYQKDGSPGSYFTFDDNNIEHIWYFLKKCHENGWLHIGHRVMPWCWRCGTSLSQHELVDSYQEQVDPSVYFKCPIVERPGESFLVWTTTPWTLTSNTALAVAPEMEYAKVRVGSEAFYVLASRLQAVLGESVEILGTVKGSSLLGLTYRGPFEELPTQAKANRRTVAWEMISAEEGTGIVHIAPGCGAEDYELSQSENLAALVPLDDNGYFVEGFGWLEGKHVRESAEPIREDLYRKGVLFKWEGYTHRYPTCWRCKTPLVFRLVDEWFICCDEIREPMKREAAKVHWIPEYGGRLMQNWLDNMGDWCISRRRFWGLPLPFYNCACGERTVVGSLQELRKLAEDSKAVDDLPELHRPWIDAIKIRCPKCAESVERCPEVGDCWLDAGIVPYSTLNYLPDHLGVERARRSIRSDEPGDAWVESFPAQWITEMREQIRLWFYSMLFMSVTLEGCAPYKTVLTYEEMRDESGEAFSKTQGNAIWFDEAAEKMGADPMRWLYAGAPLSLVFRFGYGPAEEVKRRLLTLWNVYSFFILYANEDHPPLSLPTSVNGGPMPDLPLTQMDRWLLARLHSMIRDATTAYESFDSATVTRLVETFVEELSTWYVRRNRRRFWKSDSDLDKQAAYQTLYEALTGVVRVIAPILPFTSEAMYQNLVRSVHPQAPESVHLLQWHKADELLVDQTLLDEMDVVLKVVTMGRSVRTDARLQVRQPLAKILVKPKDQSQTAMLQKLQDQILEELNVKSLSVVSDARELTEHRIKPNFSKLGPRLGKLMPRVKAALESEDASVLASRILRGESISLDIEGETIDLRPEEVEIESIPRPGLAVMEEGGYIVALDTRITKELELEGMARNLIRHIQNLRKESGFRVADRIVTEYCFPATTGTDGKWDEVLRHHGEYIKQETLSVSLEPATDSREGATITISGQPLLLHLTKAAA